MKRRMLVIATASMAFGATVSGVAAQEPEGGRPVRRERPGQRIGRERGRDAVRAEVRFNGQLRDALMSELELSDEQKTNVTRLLQEHHEAVQALARNPREGDAEDNNDARIEELERQAQAAREAGDRAEARRIQQEIRELRSGEKGANREEFQRLNHELIENIKSELTEEQTPRFEQIVHRIRAQSESGEPIMRLMQAGRRASAKLELDEDQRRKVNEVLRNVVRESMKDGERGDHAAIMENLQKEINTALGAELGEQFMQALHEEQSATASRGPGGAPGQGEEEESEQPDKDED